MDDAERRKRDERIAEAAERQARYAAENAEHEEAQYRRATETRDFSRAGNVPRAHAAWVAASSRSARWGSVDVSPHLVRASLRAAVDRCVLRAANEPDANVVKGMIVAAAKMAEILRWDGDE